MIKPMSIHQHSSKTAAGRTGKDNLPPALRRSREPSGGDPNRGDEAAE
jgi:hypothetical protein